MNKPRTNQSYLQEAAAIVRSLHYRVWYREGELGVYFIYRKGMGFLARRSGADRLVAYLRKQIPQQLEPNQKDMFVKGEESGQNPGA